MKKALIILLSIIASYACLNQFFINAYDGFTFSKSRNESISEGYFLSDYTGDKDSVNLLNRKIKVPSLWIEQAQETSHSLLFFPKKNAIQNNYNVVIDSANACNSNEYLFDLKSTGQILNCINGLGFIYLVPDQPDTLKVIVKQGSLDLGWQNEVIVDSIIYTSSDQLSVRTFH